MTKKRAKGRQQQPTNGRLWVPSWPQDEDRDGSHITTVACAAPLLAALPLPSRRPCVAPGGFGVEFPLAVECPGGRWDNLFGSIAQSPCPGAHFREWERKLMSRGSGVGWPQGRRWRRRAANASSPPYAAPAPAAALPQPSTVPPPPSLSRQENKAVHSLRK